MRLSPVDPAKFYATTALGFANFLLRRYEDAAELGRRALGDRPAFLPAHRLLVASLGQFGDRGAAEEALSALLAVAPDHTVAIAAARTSMRDPALFEGLRKAGLPE
jgi:tetratricopeptide (TPR) repeat protein